MKIAAIDIGSNAVRLQIVQVYEEVNQVSFKKVEFLRYPMRLGKDVFKHGEISKKVLNRFVKLIRAFRLLMDLHEVETYKAVATSAMREAKNNKTVIEAIQKRTGISIEIITGKEEAEFLNLAMLPYVQEDDMFHIDVGGGSTELNFYSSGKLKAGTSMKMGTLRHVSKKKKAQNLKHIEAWYEGLKSKQGANVVGIGTGGNINKLIKISRVSDGKSMSLLELKAIRAYVETHDLDERMEVLKMNRDRADVIIPAADIYISLLELVGADKILVPRVGLKDGLIYHLYQNIAQEDLRSKVFIQAF